MAIIGNAAIPLSVKVHYMENMRHYMYITKNAPTTNCSKGELSYKLYFRYSPFRIGRVTLNFTANMRTTNTVLPPIICAM